MDDEKKQPMWIYLWTSLCLLLLATSTDGVLCPNGCKCENEVLKANCSRARIEVVPIQLNPELHVMDLSFNKISQLYYTFTFYEKLITLDLSRNKVKVIGSGNFKTQKLLKALNLSGNYIESLGKDTFEGLKQLHELDLSYNELKSIAANAFKDLHGLTILRMNSNQLDYFEEGTFKYTNNLQALYINDNSFIEIPSELSVLVHLKLLSIARNLLEVIDDVPNLPELDTLVLNQNLIYEIQPTGFTDLPKLDHLDISDNNLTLLPTTPLAKLSKLVNLKISGNSFRYIPPVAFRGLFHLRYLMLARIESLEAIDARAFVDNIDLEKISMDYNYKIKTLPSRLFHGNPKLRYVSIRYNSIRTLDANHFPLDQLSDLRVGGNPLECNCSLNWLWKILHESEIQNNTNYKSGISNEKFSPINKTHKLKIDINDIVCETPEDLHNQKFTSVSQSQIDCSMSWIAIISISLTVIFISSIIAGVFFFLPKKKVERSLDKEQPKISKSNCNAPPLPPPRKPPTNRDVERYIMPPMLLQNRALPLWEPYSQHCNGLGNIYEQLNDHHDRPHIVYV